MKKIPTLFTRVFEGRKIVGITGDIAQGCEDAFLHGKATIKIDGSCCAIINGEKYKRYDAKNGKKPPDDAIPCCDPDPVTGHHPHWVKIDPNNPADKWYVAALQYQTKDGTYEAIGPHFQGNPHKLSYDNAVPHGIFEAKVERTFEGVKTWLEVNECEGLVFWLDGEPVCKIKRSDFGLQWPVK